MRTTLVLGEEHQDAMWAFGRSDGDGPVDYVKWSESQEGWLWYAGGLSWVPADWLNRLSTEDLGYQFREVGLVVAL